MTELEPFRVINDEKTVKTMVNVFQSRLTYFCSNVEQHQRVVRTGSKYDENNLKRKAYLNRKQRDNFVIKKTAGCQELR